MKLIFKYLKYKRKIIVAFLLFVTLFVVSFYLYHLPLKAVLYPAALCTLAGIMLLTADFISVHKKHNDLVYLQRLSAELIDALPDPDSIFEEDYGRMVDCLCRQQKEQAELSAVKYTNMLDYYTVWAHQIKTPIAAMRLNLQNEDSAFSRKLQNDLSRIDQYVNMVLTFLRLDSESTDYLIKEYDLDGIVRPTVKKYSGEFIGKKLKLNYSELNATVLTDEKWLSFVVEQVLSNAVKYTSCGGISIYMEEPETLCIRDTGIGISPEDLPRVFENGYTGFNGRTDKRASGIGLYLCRRICSNLGHHISAESEAGVGTVIRISFDRNKLDTR
ncbi:sensor histidine kinase [Anaerobium acetethylicum]|uniref:histidine kinase n=1 Tax=Anaerobium acetethylicum TaxID=1619234 RepID=A0A1D3TX86_9FIRM|nr:sensor histidine kinase [Anaerobium acetethylicum]SCP98912.1 hypothetical protein SAMN05421730_102838 [Anaerobium acetethylicum]